MLLTCYGAFHKEVLVVNIVSVSLIKEINFHNCTTFFPILMMMLFVFC